MVNVQHDALLAWYKKFGRHDLPWRTSDDIYHIYISEVMLQQTQVERVREFFYPRFLEHFPTLTSLANAPLSDVLALWSGLGYYRRAKNLHLLAQQTAPQLPSTYKELLALPGIGSYTASAICSFGYNHACCVVDTNISRVLKRFFALKEVTPKELEQHATNFLNIQQPRAHNLALMDLGAMVCKATNPLCLECPLRQWCQGKDDPMAYTKKKQKRSHQMDLFFGVYTNSANEVALVYSDGNMYKDMLVLPSVDPIEENLLGQYKHAYTKYKLNVYIYALEELPSSYKEQKIIWLDEKSFSKAHISSLTKKAQKLIFNKG